MIAFLAFLIAVYVIVTVALALGNLSQYLMMVSLLRETPGVEQWEYERREAAHNFVHSPLWPLNLVLMSRQAWRDAR